MMNTNITDILTLGIFSTTLAFLFLVYFIKDHAAKDKKKYLLFFGLGSGVFAFSAKILLIVSISSFPEQAISFFPKKDYEKDVLIADGKDLSNSTIRSYSWQALPLSAPAPDDNPTTAEKIALGKKLFNDKRLSLDNSISCASCHELSTQKGGADGRAQSIGVNHKKGSRNAPSVLNAAFQTVFFWDGRAQSLEQQASGPILNPVEMAMPSAQAVEQKLQAINDYQRAFAEVFKDEPAISMTNISKAIAAYERTLITPDSAYDRFIKGETTALTLQQKRGMALFASIGCIQCHSGPNFSGADRSDSASVFRLFPASPDSDFDSKFHLSDDLGVIDGAKGKKSGVWRIPSLRNVTRTAPYFHNGAVQSLEEAVAIMASVQLGKTISNQYEDNSLIFWSDKNKQLYSDNNQALNDQEIADIVAFLKALDGPFIETF